MFFKGPPKAMLKIAAAVCKQIMAAWRRVGTRVKVRSGWVLDAS